MSKFQDRRFTVRVGDNETYRTNWEQIKWPDRKEKKDSSEEKKDEKKD